MVQALLVLAILASPAGADITSTSTMAYPDSTKIAQHSNVELTVNFSYANGTANESVRGLTVETPPGALGDPQSVPEAQRCDIDYTAASPQYVNCPASSKVGDATVAVNGLNSVLGGLNLNLTGSIFLLKNRPSASPEIPGHVGIYISPPSGIPLLSVAGINLTGKITARNKTDYGLRVKILEDIPNALMSLNFLPATQIRVNQLSMRLFRLAPNGSYFATLPTRCEPWMTETFVRSWEGNAAANADIDPAIAGDDHFRSSSTTMPDCSTPPPFNPGATISSSPSVIGQPSSMTIGLTRPSAPAVTVQPHIKRVDIAFPAGVEINPALFNDTGEDLCTDAQFNKAEPDTPATCPAMSEIATITTTLPLMSQPTVGTMYLGEPGAGEADKYRAFIDLPGAMGIKFEGRVTIDEQTGQINATVGDESVDRPLPQVPYSIIELETKSGPRAAFVNPVTCGAHQGSVTFTPWSNQAPATRTITLNIDNGAEPCVPEEQRPFEPTFAMTPTSAVADSHDDYEFTIDRADGDQQIRDVAIDLPTGLIAAPANAATCSPAALSAANCPAEARVGRADVAAGSGSESFALAGEIFNVEPQAGEIASMAAVVRAVVGPFDLGNVVLPLKLSVRSDLGASAQSDPIPERVGGVAVRVRNVKVKLFGSVANGTFMRAPSRCGVHQVSARIASPAGATVNREASLTTSGCAELPFGPTLTMWPEPAAGNPTGDLPAWKIRLSARAGDSAIEGLRLTFPDSVTSNLMALDGLCSDADFIAGTCPAASTLGTVRIRTPLLAYPLDGRVLLVRNNKPGGAYPRIGLSVAAPFNIRIAGSTTFVNDKQLHTAFENLPDLPISGVEIDLHGGSRGVLQFVAANSCGAMMYALVGHGGQTRSGADAFGGKPCASFQQQRCSAGTFGVRTSGSKKARGKRARLTVKIKVPQRCPAIRSLKISLPRGTKVKRAAIRKSASARLTAAADSRTRKLRRGSVKVTRREIRLSVMSTPASSITLSTTRGSVRLAPCKKRQRCWKRKVTFTARALLDDGTTWTSKVTLRRSSRLLR